MRLLITGGAGYIGSHAVRQLLAAGYEVTVLDNLSFGHREAVADPRVTFIKGEVGDRVLLTKLFKDAQFEAVMHFAAYAHISESVEDPLSYYQNNVAAPLVLLQVMEEYQVTQFILSSTCATYGIPDVVPIRESQTQKPINPYGASKLMLEQILSDCGKAWGLRSICLRYFNAAGCSLDGSLGEDHTPELHLIPIVLQVASGKRESVTIFGDDYATEDGSCVRDYIHVEDVASAHVRALKKLESGVQSMALNLGTGRGYSVKEIIETVKKVTGKSISVKLGGRREGDPPALVADPSKAQQELGWQAERSDLQTIVESAWNWFRVKPEGYSSK